MLMEEAANPFRDPSTETRPTPDHIHTHDSTDFAILTVDRNATLTLGTDSLIVLDEGLRLQRSATNCCGLLPQFSKTTRAIPFHNILWADLHDLDLIIRYTQPVGRKGKSCKVAAITHTITDKSSAAHAERWVGRLLERAYPPSTQRRKRIKVLVNPFGGQGYAQKLWERDVEPIFRAAGCEVDIERTTYRGHAVEIAKELDIEKYDVVACASGDGLPHEVFNGLAKHAQGRRALSRIAVVQIPCGSGNAMSLNLNGTDDPSLAALEIVKGTRTKLDLVAITQGKEKFYSFLSQAVGIIAETDLGTESLRWMGSFRFTWGVLVRVLGKTIYPAEVSMVVETENKQVIKDSYRQAVEEHAAARAKHIRRDDTQEDGPDTELPALQYGSVIDSLHSDFTTQDMPNLGNFYVGNMCYMSPDTPFFIASLPSDGRMDLVSVPGDVPRLTALKMLATVEDGKIMAFPEVTYRKVLAYRISPRMAPAPKRGGLRRKLGLWLGGAGGQKEGLIAIDGEKIPFQPFQAEVVPKLGTVLSKSGGVYEVGGLL